MIKKRKRQVDETQAQEISIEFTPDDIMPDELPASYNGSLYWSTPNEINGGELEEIE